MGSHQAEGAGEPRVMALSSNRGYQTLAPSLGIYFKSSSISLPPCSVCAWMMACVWNLSICRRVISSVSSALLILTGFGTWEAIVD